MIGKKGQALRERQVLALYADGFSYAEISEQLEIAPSTVSTYLARARERYDALGKGRRSLIKAYLSTKT